MKEVLPELTVLLHHALNGFLISGLFQVKVKQFDVILKLLDSLYMIFFLVHAARLIN